MQRIRQVRSLLFGLLTVLVAVGWLAATSSFAADTHMSKPFAGVKVNGGTVTHAK